MILGLLYLPNLACNDSHFKDSVNKNIHYTYYMHVHIYIHTHTFSRNAGMQEKLLIFKCFGILTLRKLHTEVMSFAALAF